MRHEPKRQESVHAHAQVPSVPQGMSDWCDEDFPLGTHMTNDCANPSRGEVPADKAQCEQAMVQAGAVYLDNRSAHFEISDANQQGNYYNKYPKGCFRLDSTDGRCGSNNMCYYFNECEGAQCGDSTTITGGTPVCHRPKIKFGTTNANTCDQAGYDNIKDRFLCEELTGCLSHCAGSPFRSNHLNASRYHIFPKWCYIDSTDGCAYYNDPLIPDDGSVTFPMPSAPKGQPVCNVTFVGGGPSDPNIPTSAGTHPNVTTS